MTIDLNNCTGHKSTVEKQGKKIAWYIMSRIFTDICDFILATGKQNEIIQNCTWNLAIKHMFAESFPSYLRDRNR